MSDIRIFINSKLGVDCDIRIIDKDFHYLANVMRVKVGDGVRLVNGVDGEFLSNVVLISKKYLILKILKKSKDFSERKFLGLIFSPIQKIDLLLKGATEIGTTDFFPVITDYTNKFNIKIDKMKDNIIEAVEQSERVDLPRISETQKLLDMLKKIESKNSIIFFCEERSLSNNPLNIYNNFKNDIINKNIYALIGPEGGFSQKEKDIIKSFKNVISISLSDTILRSETAAVSILSIIKTFYYE